MNWLDIVIIIILALSTYIGLKTGIIRVLALFAGIVIGVVLAGQAYDVIASPIEGAVGASTAKIIGFAVIIIVVTVIAAFIGRMVRGVVRFMFMGWVDSLVGAAVGLLIGFLLCGAALVGLYSFVVLGEDLPEDLPEELQAEWLEQRLLDSDTAEKIDTAYRASGMWGAYKEYIPPLLDLLPGEEFGPVKDWFELLSD